MARRWTVRLVACVVAAPLLVAGCSGKQQANDSLPTTKTATTTKALPALGPADFPVPAEARKKTRAGVEASVKYYIALSNHLLSNLDSAPLRDLSQNCQSCTELADGYDTAKTQGRTFVGGELTVTGMGSVQLEDGKAEVSIVLRQDAVTVRDASGAVIEAESSGSYNLGGGVALSWDAHRSAWLVTQLDADRQ
jgi:Family of unknown function (DUF6318)